MTESDSITNSSQCTPADIVLIDDDELIRMTWETSAKNQGVRLRCFEKFAEFIKIHEQFDKAVPIYIDSHLANETKGEIAAKSLFEIGFKNLYLCTGYQDSQFPEMPWIRAIVGKSPPFKNRVSIQD